MSSAPTGHYEKDEMARCSCAADSPVVVRPDRRTCGRPAGMMYLICYMRQQDRVFETYWTTIRGVEAMDYSYTLLDLTLSTTARAAFVTRPLLR
jgi:predicted dithiol-disulfide oxidoreductase (DUF899 family)